jgi:hypothetical protein
MQEEFLSAFLVLTLPQLPMTLLNSMVAVEALAKDLFPGKDCGVPRLGYSLAFANLGLSWFGGLPSCHGNDTFFRLRVPIRQEPHTRLNSLAHVPWAVTF